MPVREVIAGIMGDQVAAQTSACLKKSLGNGDTGR